MLFWLSLSFLKKLTLFSYNLHIIEYTYFKSSLSFEKCVDSYTFTILPSCSRHGARV